MRRKHGKLTIFDMIRLQYVSYCHIGIQNDIDIARNASVFKSKQPDQHAQIPNWVELKLITTDIPIG